MARDKFLLPFGGGLDRKTGSAVVDPDAFADLRNVYLFKGSTELRRGLERSLNIGWGTDIIGIYSIRAQGLAAIVVFDDVSRDVRLYLVDDAGGIASLVGTLWTLPADAAARCSGVDMYNTLVIAHDEPVFANRQATKVLDTVTIVLSDYTSDLDRDGSAETVRFRGVARHLNYLLGWGYGTGGDEDRAETLRISLPGQPVVLVPEHYFNVGVPGDPIIGGGKVGGIFGVYKSAEAWRLVGHDRQTFGILPMDDSYGLAGSRLHVTVVNESYRWSLEGPRVSNGGPSIDLEMPLDLAGPEVDPLAIADAEIGFTFHDRIEKEVVFCFGEFAFVLHFRDGARRWSYRQYAYPLMAAGVMYEGGGATLSMAAAEVASLTYVEPAYTLFLPPDTEPKVDVNWTMNGALVGGEEVQVWTRSSFGADPWTLRDTFPATDLTGTVAVPHFWTDTEIAIRTVIAGSPGAGYLGAPDTWPAVSRSSLITGGTPASWGTLSPTFTRISATDVRRIFPNYKGPGMVAAHAELTYEVEKSSDGGGIWSPATAHDPGGGNKGIDQPNADQGTAWRYRIRVVGPDGASAFVAQTGDTVLNPAPPSNVQVAAASPPSVPFDPHDHVVTADYGTDQGTVEMRAAHWNGGAGTLGPYSATVEDTYPTAISGTCSVPDHGSGRPQDIQGEARTKLTAFGVDDFSAWVTDFLVVTEPV